MRCDTNRLNRRLELQIILYVGGWNHISAPLHDATVVEWRGRVNLFNSVHIVERVAVCRQRVSRGIWKINNFALSGWGNSYVEQQFE